MRGEKTMSKWRLYAGLFMAGCLAIASRPGMATDSTAREPATSAWHPFDSYIGKTFAGLSSRRRAKSDLAPLVINDVLFTRWTWLIPGDVAMATDYNGVGDRVSVTLYRSTGGRRFDRVLLNLGSDESVRTSVVASPDGSLLVYGFGEMRALGTPSRGFLVQFEDHRFGDGIRVTPGHVWVADERFEYWTTKLGQPHADLFQRPSDPSAQQQLDRRIAAATEQLLLRPTAPAGDGFGENEGSQAPGGAQQLLSLLSARGNIEIEGKWRDDFSWNQFVAVAMTCKDLGINQLTFNACLYDDPVLLKSIQVAPYKVSSAEIGANICESVFWAPAPEVNTPSYGWGVAVMPPISIEWSRVTEVSQDGAHVFVSEKIPLRLTLSSEALAARTAFAMEFLRVHCDETAGTGF